MADISWSQDCFGKSTLPSSLYGVSILFISPSQTCRLLPSGVNHTWQKRREENYVKERKDIYA